MNLASDKIRLRHQSDVLGRVITSEFDNLAASQNVKVVTKQSTIEAMLRAGADRITDEGHILYQIIISWNATLHRLYIAWFVDISCSGGGVLMNNTYSQSAVASQLHQHIRISGSIGIFGFCANLTVDNLLNTCPNVWTRMSKKNLCPDVEKKIF